MQLNEGSRRIRVAMVATGVVVGSMAVFAVPPLADAAAPAKPTVSKVFNTNFHVPSGSNGGGPRITVRGAHFVHVCE